MSGSRAAARCRRETCRSATRARWPGTARGDRYERGPSKGGRRAGNRDRGRHRDPRGGRGSAAALLSCGHDATHTPSGHVRAVGHGGSAAVASALGGAAAAGEGEPGAAGSGPGFGALLTLSLCPQVSYAAAFGALPKRVKVVEVGPRDGLQNEKVRTGPGLLQAQGPWCHQQPVPCVFSF